MYLKFQSIRYKNTVNLTTYIVIVGIVSNIYKSRNNIEIKNIKHFKNILHRYTVHTKHISKRIKGTDII